jgi:hypothetical protein
MGYFTIDIPSFGRVEVRHGTVRKKKRFRLFARRSDKPSRFAGYLVTFRNTRNEKETWQLFKFPGRKWSTDPDGAGELDDDRLIEIRDAIERHENEKP